MQTGTPRLGHINPSTDNRALFRHVLQTVLRGRWVFLASLLLFVGLSVLYLTLSDPIYEAETSVIIEPEAEEGKLDLTGLGVYRDVLVEVEVLQSLDLAKRVAARLESERAGSSNFPVFDEVPAGSAPVVLARALQERIQIEQVRREVGIVRIASRSTVPAEARRIAELYAEEYTTRNLEMSREEARGLRAFLEEQATARHVELQDAEGALQEYQESEQAIGLDREAVLLTQQMADLQSLRDQAQVELEMVQAELVSLQAEAQRIEPNLYDRVASGLEGSIAALQREIADREVRIEEKYARNPTLRGNESADPELQREVAELASLRQRVDERARSYVDEVLAAGGIDPDVASRLGEGAGVPGALANISRLRTQITAKNIQASGLRARVGVLRSRLAGYQREFARIPEQARQVASLERSRRTAELTVDWLQQRYQEARIAEESEFGYVRILDRAELPGDPVAPRAAYALALGMLMGLLTGLLLVFGRDMLDDRVRLPEDLSRAGLDVIGVVPDLSRMIRDGRSAHSGRSEVVSVWLPQSAAADAYARIAMGAEMAAVGHPLQTVAVTSCKSRDGKTTTASNLAVTMARAGHRTLLLDLNAWNPEAHQFFGAEGVPGISNILFEGCLARDAVRASSVDGLYVMPLGDIDATNLLASPDLGALVAYLRRAFGRIVIDGGPLLEAGRAVALSALADAVVLVARAGKTTNADLRDAHTLLQQAKAPSVHAVLNGFHARRAIGYYAERSYYGKYGSGRERRLPASSDSPVRRRPAPARPMIARAPERPAHGAGEARIYSPDATPRLPGG